METEGRLGITKSNMTKTGCVDASVQSKPPTVYITCDLPAQSSLNA
jgi:hypothetical protein